MNTNGFKRVRKFKINIFFTVILVFVLAMAFFNFVIMNQFLPTNTYYTDSGNISYPVIYQQYADKRINKLFAYKSEKYNMIANESLSLIDNERKLNLLIQRNDYEFSELEYEIRDKTTKELIERTRVPILDSKSKEVFVTLQIQNLITRGNTYTLQIKIDLLDEKIYYFTNIMYKTNTKLPEVLDFIGDYTLKSFDKAKASDYEFVKYLETSPNRDLKQLNTVNIESSFEQITWADTKMKLLSDLYYRVYQSQDYCYNIDVDYFCTCERNGKKEYYMSIDKYVIRWDGIRYYIMKFDRHTEELLNLDTDPFDFQKKRLYLGVTNLKDLQKIESEDQTKMIFCKQKEIYYYDSTTAELKNIYANLVRTKEDYDRLNRNTNVKLISLTNEGDCRFIIYGYNMKGNNEGYNGISLFNYSAEKNQVEEVCFIPVYTTYQNLKYDLNKLSTLIGDNLYFKIYDKIYTINIMTEELIEIIHNIEETQSAATLDGLYFAYNDSTVKGNTFRVLDVANNTGKEIKVAEDEIVEVIGCMNDDVIYGITKEDYLWIEQGKIIGRPFDRIEFINMTDGEKRVFDEEGIYYYNFVTSQQNLEYNKYQRNNNHFNIVTNGVIINNIKQEKESIFVIGEEFTKDKLRIAYISIETDKDINYSVIESINLKQEILYNMLEGALSEPNIFYVYTNGDLISKRKNLADGISEIRDSYGYVKLNDNTTCYNRSNKANSLYPRLNDTILENLAYFEEDFTIVENSTLVVNITGVTERDMEYYISLNEKVALFRDDRFQFFITGYDNSNYVLEYIDGERQRVLTPRSQVHQMVMTEGYISFVQLENLE